MNIWGHHTYFLLQLWQRGVTVEGWHDWRECLAAGFKPEQAAWLRRYERTGRPLGSAASLKRRENRLDRVLRKKTPGRKPKKKQK